MLLQSQDLGEMDGKTRTVHNDSERNTKKEARKNGR